MGDHVVGVLPRCRCIMQIGQTGYRRQTIFGWLCSEGRYICHDSGGMGGTAVHEAA